MKDTNKQNKNENCLKLNPIDDASKNKHTHLLYYRIHYAKLNTIDVMCC